MLSGQQVGYTSRVGTLPPRPYCVRSRRYSVSPCMPSQAPAVQIGEVMLTATCRDTGLDSTMTIQVGDRQHSIPVDGQARNPGLPSLRECISRSYGQARWLYELPGMATDPESDEWADGVKKNPDPLASWHWHWHQQARTPALYHLDPSGVNELAMVVHWWVSLSHTLIRFQLPQ